MTETDAAMLDFERQRWAHPGAKDAAIRERFGIPAWTYYAQLGRLLDDPEAEAHDPQTVRRLRRLREARRAVRAGDRGPLTNG